MYHCNRMPSLQHITSLWKTTVFIGRFQNTHRELLCTQRAESLHIKHWPRHCQTCRAQHPSITFGPKGRPKRKGFVSLLTRQSPTTEFCHFRLGCILRDDTPAILPGLFFCLYKVERHLIHPSIIERRSNINNKKLFCLPGGTQQLQPFITSPTCSSEYPRRKLSSMRLALDGWPKFHP
jgi:hypothetical protein